MTTMASTSSFLATRRGKLTLALLCAGCFLDFVDASIVNVALPSIRRDLHFSVQSLVWVTSGYLLTYGGFMLLGGRAVRGWASPWHTTRSSQSTCSPTPRACANSTFRPTCCDYCPDHSCRPALGDISNWRPQPIARGISSVIRVESYAGKTDKPQHQGEWARA